MARDRRQIPSVGALEGRVLLTVASSNYSARLARARHEEHRYESTLQQVELHSHATTAQAQALRDAARAIGAAAAATGPTPQSAQDALAVTLLLDRAPLVGGLGPSGWADVEGRLERALDGLGVGPALYNQTLAAIRDVAASAGVTPGEFQTLVNVQESYRSARDRLPAGAPDFPDPDTYYTQHLRGFFRGGEADRRQAGQALDAELSAVASAAGDSPAQAALLRRDAQLLERIGATLTADAFDPILATYVGAFATRPPDGPTLAADIKDQLGPAATAATLRDVDRLAGDAGAFFAAAGSSASNVGAIADAVRGSVAAGGGATLNPFRVAIPRRSTG